MDYNEIYDMMKYIKDDINTDDSNSTLSNNSDNEDGRVTTCEQYGCNHINTVEDANVGDTICMDCGFVLNERKIDNSGEYMGMTQDKAYSCSRVGYPSQNVSLLNNEQSQTLISSYKDKNNLRRWHNCLTISSKDRSLLANYNVIEQYCFNLNITQHSTHLSKYIYKKCSEVKITRGSIKKSLIASCIYIACEHTGLTRITTDIICKECNTESKYMSKTNKFVYSVVWTLPDLKDVILCFTSLDDHLFNYCSKLNISGSQLINVKKFSDDIIKKYPDILNKINERSYIIIAIIFIYLLNNNNSVKKCDFCIKFNISQITLSKSVKIIKSTMEPSI